MNCRTKAMSISLLLHGAALSLVFALSSSLAKQDKSIVIDFTLVEPNSLPSPAARIPQKWAEIPASAKIRPLSTPPKQKVTPPAPATETEGPVAILAKQKEPNPLPMPHSAVVSAPNAVPGGTGGPGAPGKSLSAGAGHGDLAERLSSRYRAENFAYIKKIIEENLSYPHRARRMGWVGRVVVSFDVTQGGHVREIRIVKSTGYELLDTNVIDTINKVGPFPRPPIPVMLTIPFTYSLE